MKTSIKSSVSDLNLCACISSHHIITGKFLLNNYRQALAIINEYSHEVKDLTDRLGIQESHFEKWLEAERRFLQELKDEPEEHVLACAYVEALIAKKLAEYVYC